MFPTRRDPNCIGASDDLPINRSALRDLRFRGFAAALLFSALPDAARYFMFADHSIALPTYAIRLSDDPDDDTPVASVFADAGAFGIKVYFKSFTDFVTAYLNDPIKTSAAIPVNV